MTPLERIIRPIVEGQIRGFLKEHPAIVAAVDWYKPRTDKATTFVNSLAKRIVRDLTCGNVAARLAAALLECPAEAPSLSAVAWVSAPTPARLACELSEPEPPRVRRKRILRAPSSLSPTALESSRAVNSCRRPDATQRIGGTLLTSGQEGALPLVI